MTFGITADEVRNIAGLTSAEISDAIVNAFVEEAEYETEQTLKTKFSPTTVIERRVIENSEPPFIMLNNTPVSTVLTIYIGGTGGYQIDPSDTILDNRSGKLRLKTAAKQNYFTDVMDTQNIIEYQYAKLDETSTATRTTTRTGTGAVTLAVSSSAGFDNGQYIKVEGYEGASEIAIVTGTGAGTISATMKWVHESNARVNKMSVPNVPKELCKVIAAIKCLINRIGGTYNNVMSYTLPELTVTKGGPLAHYREIIDYLTGRRDWLIQRFRPQFAIA